MMGRSQQDETRNDGPVEGNECTMRFGEEHWIKRDDQIQYSANPSTKLEFKRRSRKVNGKKTYVLHLPPMSLFRLHRLGRADVSIQFDKTVKPQLSKVMQVRYSHIYLRLTYLPFACQKCLTLACLLRMIAFEGDENLRFKNKTSTLIS